MYKDTTRNVNVKRVSHLPVINPSAAGIDVSDTEMMVAYPVNSEDLHIEAFGSFTRDLHLLAKTLQQNGITTITMESTRVYWVALFLILQDYGLKFIL